MVPTPSTYHRRRETIRHFRIQANLDASLNLVLGLDEHVEHLLGVNNCLAVVRHQTNDGRVPLVDNLAERGRARSHQDLAHTVLELVQTALADAEESLSRALLGLLVGQVPAAFLERELLVQIANLGQDADLYAVGCQGLESALRTLELRLKPDDAQH